MLLKKSLLLTPMLPKVNDECEERQHSNHIQRDGADCGHVALSVIQFVFVSSKIFLNAKVLHK